MTLSLVTGAGGFVAGHLCRHLEGRGGAVRRISSSRPDPSWRQITLLGSGDAEIEAALEGVARVYFLAGIAHEAAAAGDPHLMRRVNVDAPLRWLRAADRSGVSRFVWLSSIKVLGDVSARPLEPDDAYRPGDAYARSKVQAEQRLLEADLRRTRLTVVRPPLVYGPGVRGNFLSLLRLAAGGLPLPLGRADAPRSLVSVDNLCDLLMRAGEAGDGIVHAADGDDVSVTGLITRIRALLGRSPRQLGLPPALMRTGLRAIGRGDAYVRLFEPLRVSTAATRSRLGWSPPQTVAAGLEDTVTWFRTSP